ncbi:uroplakin-2 [Puntigrus tetrazona]|uniref:uroplakin-2 n=1 Tax=Puntigrus tetrazona TaxID=1606681 RepID=UPI001C8A79F2|nr:uroplakin-2 [Puntigrus tetrazona]
MLAVLFILGTLFPLNFAEISIKLLDTNDGVFSGAFPNSFLLSLPDCGVYANRSATLLYAEAPSSQSQNQSFVVPSCNPKQLGLLLEDLKQGTEYTMWYQIANETSSKLTGKTISVVDYQQIDSGLKARSGAMVVITVILSLAMVMLLVGLFISLFFSG